jgi:hypothetical protein
MEHRENIMKEVLADNFDEVPAADCNEIAETGDYNCSFSVKKI